MQENKVICGCGSKPVIFTSENAWINLGYIEENTIWTDPCTGRKYKRYFDGREVEINDDL